MQHLSANIETQTNFSKFQHTFLCALDSYVQTFKKCYNDLIHTLDNVID